MLILVSITEIKDSLATIIETNRGVRLEWNDGTGGDKGSLYSAPFLLLRRSSAFFFVFPKIR